MARSSKQPKVEVKGKGAWLELNGSRAVMRGDGPVARVELARIRHVERDGGRLTVRWGISTRNEARHLEVPVGALTAADRAQEISGFLDQHLPGHLHWSCDEDGITYSRLFDLDELDVHSAPTVSIRGRGLDRKRKSFRARSDHHEWRVELDGGFVAYPSTKGDAAELLLIDNRIVLGSGLLLGTVRPSESGGRTVVFGDRTVFELLNAGRAVLRDGARVGSYRRKTIKFEAKQPEFVAVALFLVLLDRDYAQPTEDEREPKRKRRVTMLWYSTYLLCWGILSSADYFGDVVVLFAGFVLAVALVIFFRIRDRRRREFVGVSPEDSNERRRRGRRGAGGS